MESSLIAQFANYLRFERHFSPYTARCYEADLRQYVEFLCSELVHAQPSGTASGEPAPTVTLPTESITGSVAIAAPVMAETQVDLRIKAADPVSLRAYLAHLDSFAYSTSTVARKNRHAAILPQMADQTQQYSRQPPCC
ncbi:MAG: site-specific integrase [Phycisphaerales bacterium]|nr:site-specific integrase [Phycisphaerales bacterium]